MEKWRFERVKKILKDYNDTDDYVNQIIKSIRTPYKETDINADIKGTKKDHDTMFSELWTIETHKALNCLKRNKSLVEKLLDECGSDTETNYSRVIYQEVSQVYHARASDEPQSKLRKKQSDKAA